MKKILTDGFKTARIKPVWLLVTGMVLMALSHMSWNIDLLAWISMVPFLIYLNITRGLRSRLVFALFLVITWSLIVLKIFTEPVPYFLIPLYSVPLAIIHLPGYLLYGYSRNHRISIFIFPAIMVILEWIQYTFTPFASWGVAAYTQANSIGIMQGVSLFGMAGLSFMIYWTNSALANLLLSGKHSFANLSLPLICLLLLCIFGGLRYGFSGASGRETLKVAAVGTDSEIGGLPLPSPESNREVIKAIFSRTEKASGAGARLIVWNEAAFYLTPENESLWSDSIGALAKEKNIAIVASWVVPLPGKPFRYENKFVLYGPDGEIKNIYHKHQPVPGEPAIKGKEKIISAALFGSNIGGAICYDYDFPYLAKENMNAGTDIVALPSSDWRGIDPLHTRMACFRAIEQGHSIVRSTRFGLSAAINPYGEITAFMSSFDKNDKIMISNLPLKKVKTLYARTGDVFVFGCIGFLVVGLIWVVVINRRT